MANNLNLKITGMTCGSCSKSITTRLSKFEFTENVNIDWEGGTGSLDIIENFEENKELVLQTIDKLGFTAILN